MQNQKSRLKFPKFRSFAQKQRKITQKWSEPMGSFGEPMGSLPHPQPMVWSRWMAPVAPRPPHLSDLGYGW